MSPPAIAASSSAQHATVGARGPAESSVPDSGNTPSSGIRPTVVFKPVTPQKAAGIRTEPPVSLPMAAAAMPSVTETAAPEDDPPGMRPQRAVPRVPGRAEMRVDADTRIGELGEVGPAQHDRAGRAQPRDDRGVAAGRRFVGERRRGSRGDFAGDIEQVLHRNRQPGERRGDHAGLSERIARVGLGPRAIGVAGQERPRAFALGRLDGRKRPLHQIATRRRARGHVPGELRQGRGTERHGVSPRLRRPRDLNTSFRGGQARVAASAASGKFRRPSARCGP